MRIAIFGSTGKTGLLVVKEALKKGHEVVAFARSPEKIRQKGDRLTVVKGDLGDRNAINETIQGADAVISVLGPASNKVKFEISSGMQQIASSMIASKVRRIVITAGAGVADPDDQPTFMSRFMNRLVRTISKNVYEDMVRTVQIVRDSGLDWTIVRAPMLTDQPKTGSVTVAWVGKGMRRQVTREDLAEFVVSQIDDDTYIRKAPTVSN